MDFYFAGTQHETSEQLITELNCHMLKSYYNDMTIINRLMELKRDGKWQGKRRAYDRRTYSQRMAGGYG